ncbi:DUF4129 domain-containing protein [Microbacterium sp. NPDC003461]
MSPLQIPVTPGPDEAREWAERELADRVYDAAEPTLIDRIAQAIGEFFANLLRVGVGAEWSPLLTLVVIVVIAAVVVLGLLIWGRPRSAHRARAASSSVLFGEDETRSAAELRASAAEHAAAGRWDQAVIERYRALARGMEERDVLDALPGTTAQALAANAAPFFPAQAQRLHDGAVAFDDVRYLRRRGTAQMYEGVAAVDDEIARTRPARLADPLDSEPVRA